MLKGAGWNAKDPEPAAEDPADENDQDTAAAAVDDTPAPPAPEPEPEEVRWLKVLQQFSIRLAHSYHNSIQSFVEYAQR